MTADQTGTDTAAPAGSDQPVEAAQAAHTAAARRPAASPVRQTPAEAAEALDPGRPSGFRSTDCGSCHRRHAGRADGGGRCAGHLPRSVPHVGECRGDEPRRVPAGRRRDPDGERARGGPAGKATLVLALAALALCVLLFPLEPGLGLDRPGVGRRPDRGPGADRPRLRSPTRATCRTSRLDARLLLQVVQCTGNRSAGDRRLPHDPRGARGRRGAAAPRRVRPARAAQRHGPRPPSTGPADGDRTLGHRDDGKPEQTR